jgi:WD40 repeat protein
VAGPGTELWLNKRKDKVASNGGDTNLASASDKDKSSTASNESQESLCQVAQAADEPAIDQSEGIPRDVIGPEGDLDDDVQMSTDSDSSAGNHADVPLLVSADGSSDDDEESEYIYLDEEDEDYEDETSPNDDIYNGVPVVRPRMKYTGAANTRTIKDGQLLTYTTHRSCSSMLSSVNFIGPGDELVASGSDDGNFFLWDKMTGKLQGIYEGDGSIVNVIEAHPFLPILAVSGIDSTVKVMIPSSFLYPGD